MRNLILFLNFLLLSLGLYSQEYIQNHTGDYFGQTLPKDSAVIFAPGIISVPDRSEYGLAISPSHDEIYVTASGTESSDLLKGLIRIKRNGDKWLIPEIANLNQSGLWEQEAFFTSDGNTVYYAVSDSIFTKIWFSDKTENGWSKGKLLNTPINESAKRLFYNSFSSNGNLYYTNVDEVKIYMSENKNNSYIDYNDIGLPRAGHAFIAPDESFILLDSRQSETFGKLDIYVAFKQEDGSWGEPINLGPKVNTEYLETCPSLSPDGKYIFFGRYNDINEKSNIYWISSIILEELKP